MGLNVRRMPYPEDLAYSPYCATIREPILQKKHVMTLNIAKKEFTTILALVEACKMRTSLISSAEINL